MRKSHRDTSRHNPSIDHGVQKFEGEGVKRYRNVIEKSYGSDTGNPAKEIRHASERKPKSEVIKALRLTRGEHLEMQPRSGKKDIRSELPQRRARGGHINSSYEKNEEEPLIEAVKNAPGHSKPLVTKRPDEIEKWAREEEREPEHKNLKTGGSVGLKPIKIKRPGALHKKMGIPIGKKIPQKSLLAEKHSNNPLTRKQATFAINARKWHHE